MKSINTLKLAIVTGSRADYGLLQKLIFLASQDKYIDLQFLVTGSHLNEKQGNTIDKIISSRIPITRTVELPLEADSLSDIANTIACGINEFVKIFQDIKPNLVLILGDRYEIFSVAQAAMITTIPIAHIAGGDTTEGAIDEAIRHSITKMAHLHFVTNQNSKQRVIQMGENPDRVYNVGSPGIDTLLDTELLTRPDLENSLQFKFQDKNLLVTFHPETISPLDPEQQCQQLLTALESVTHNIGIIFTGANADSGGKIINSIIQCFVQSHPNCLYVTSLGQQRYYSCIKHVDAVIGNSSSGLYETASLNTPTLNIGDRQKGRLQPNSVINCSLSNKAIRVGIDKVLRFDCSNFSNPYGDGKSSIRIIEIIKDTFSHISDNDDIVSTLLKKHFHNVTQVPA